MDDGGVQDGALAQQQAVRAQALIHRLKDLGSQLKLCQQAAEVEDGGFIQDAIGSSPANWCRIVVKYSLPPSLDRCSRTNSASDAHAA